MEKDVKKELDVKKLKADKLKTIKANEIIKK